MLNYCLVDNQFDNYVWTFWSIYKLIEHETVDRFLLKMHLKNLVMENEQENKYSPNKHGWL